MTSLPPVRPIDPVELVDVLRLVLTDADGRVPAPQSQARAFARDLRATSAKWRGFVVDGTRPSTAGAFLAVCLPGGTAIGLPASPRLPGMQWAALVRAAEATIAALEADGFHYVQSLLECEDVARLELLREAGFLNITRLEYLERNTRYPFVEANNGRVTNWVHYSNASHEQFCRLITSSYETSLDCPEINGLRPIEDILATHRSCGEFNPALWFVAEVDGETAGCILVGPHPKRSFGEVTYMGIAPSFRGQGLGDVLVRHALIACRSAKMERMILVVDQRNTPAKRVYARNGFQPFAARSALVRIFSR
ncbi:MAG: GNAT family N-acetyltransferase [Phycisphaerae bacterium]